MDKELQNLLDNYEQAIYGYTEPIIPSIHQIHLLLDYVSQLDIKVKKQKEVKDIMNYINNLEQQVKTQQLMINKAIDLLNAYIGVLDDTSDLYFENVKSILELEVKEVSK